MFFHGFLREPQGRSGKVVAQKIETFFYPANEGLIGVFLQFQCTQTLIQPLYRPAVVPARFAQDQDIAHVADVKGVLFCKLFTQCLQVQRPKDRAQRAAARNTAFYIPVVAAKSDTAADHLVQVMAQIRVLNMIVDHVHQQVLVD